MTSLSKWIVVHVLINSVTGVLDKLSSLHKVMFLPASPPIGRCDAAGVMAPEGERAGKKYRRRRFWKSRRPQHRECTPWDNISCPTDSWAAHFLLTALFWLRQHFGIDKKTKQKTFFLQWLSERERKRKKNTSIIKNEWKSNTFFPPLTKIYKGGQNNVVSYCVSYLTFVWLSLSRRTAEPKPSERRIIALQRSIRILHLNEWFQACQTGWQVFINGFTDDKLHRFTLEGRSPDVTLLWFVRDGGGGINIRRFVFCFVFSRQAHIVNNGAIFNSNGVP